MRKYERSSLALSFLLSLALVLSIYLFFQTYVISLDGAFQYIPMARMFSESLFRDGMNYSGQQPLYPLLIAFVSRWTCDYELAGRLISSFFGILLIFPVYFLGKRLFDQRIGFLSALLITIHPYVRRFSADVLKESTYLFFLATALWFTCRTFEQEKWNRYLFIPLLSLIAYFVRSDGFEVLLGGIFYILFVKNFPVPAEKRKVILVLLFTAAILFVPYLVHLRGTTGEWTLSKTKPLTEWIGWKGLGGDVPFLTRILDTFKRVNSEILSVCHPLYLLLMGVGIWKKVRCPMKSGEGILFSFYTLHYGILFLLVLNFTDWSRDGGNRETYFSGRHVLPLLLFSIYWVGEGFLAIAQWIARKVHSVPLLNKIKSRYPIVFAVLLILVSASILPKTIKPQRYERLTEKWAGIWIQSQKGKGTIIFTTVPRVAYYAEGNYESIHEKDKPKEVLASMVNKKAAYLVIRATEEGIFKEIVEPPGNHLVEVKRYGEKVMEKLIIYQRI